MLFGALPSPAHGYDKIIPDCPCHIQRGHKQVGSLGPNPRYNRQRYEEEARDKMEITWFTKIGPGSVNAGYRNTL